MSRALNALHRLRHVTSASLLAGLMPASGAVSAESPTITGDPCRSLSTVSRDQLLVQVPFETVDGRLYVKARVNAGAEFRFAVDTGASGLARADTRLRNVLDLPVVGQSGNSDGVQTATVETVHIDSLQLDGLRRDEVEAITRDYRAKLKDEAAFDGILARDFFADGLLIIDYPKKTLSFSRTLSLSRGQAQVLPYTRAFRVPVKLGGQQLEGNLDTGANVTLVLPRSLYDLLEAGPLADTGRGQLSNTSIEMGKATVHGPLQIGGLVLSDLDARVSDRFPELLVGALALQESVLMIDQRSASVAVCAP